MEVDDASELGRKLVRTILDSPSGVDLYEEVSRQIVDQHAPIWFQLEEEGTSPLHAAAYVQGAKLVDLLIENGVVWNAVDHLGNTAGDIALSFNDSVIYQAIRAAGIRSEYLLNFLSSRNSLPDGPANMIVRQSDDTAAGATDAFLSSRLHFSTHESGQDMCTVVAGGEEVGVMMGWERGIMQATVQKLCHDHPRLDEGLRILNIGFGLGVIDSLFEGLPTLPSVHYIVEPHPDVLQHMRDRGWYDKPHVRILAGRWQDFVDTDDLLELGGFDVVYTDTFSEDYEALKLFFDHVPNLLREPVSRFGFFNGLGATNALFYDVYTNVSELHMSDVGLKVQWTDVEPPDSDGDEDYWHDTRKYFTQRLYRMPIASLSV